VEVLLDKVLCFGNVGSVGILLGRCMCGLTDLVVSGLIPLISLNCFGFIFLSILGGNFISLVLTTGSLSAFSFPFGDLGDRLIVVPSGLTILENLLEDGLSVLSTFALERSKLYAISASSWILFLARYSFSFNSRFSVCLCFPLNSQTSTKRANLIFLCL